MPDYRTRAATSIAAATFPATSRRGPPFVWAAPDAVVVWEPLPLDDVEGEVDDDDIDEVVDTDNGVADDAAAAELLDIEDTREDIIGASARHILDAIFWVSKPSSALN
jgi:hypothetical protein